MAVVEIDFPGNLGQVETIADLRAVPSYFLTDDLLYAVLDGGFFRWDPSSLAADDGINVVKPNDRTSLQAGRWLLASDISDSTLRPDLTSSDSDKGVGIPVYNPEANYAPGTAGSYLKKVQDYGSSPRMGNISRRRVVHNLPLFFPDYDALLAEYSAQFLYPSAFAIDEQANELFVTGGFDSTSYGVNWVTVWNWTTGAYKGCFKIAPDDAAEGLEVLYEGGNRYIYVANGTSISRYDITTLPANRSAPTINTSYPCNLYSQFSYSGGKWYVEQNTLVIANIRNVWHEYSADLSTVTGVRVFDIDDIGFITKTTSAAGENIPKKQGVAFGSGVILSGHGGIHIEGDPEVFYAYQGTKAYSPDGKCISRSITSPERFIDLLEAEGYPCSRIENEGVKILPSGKAYSLYVHRGRTDTIPSPTLYQAGLIIFEEFSLSEAAIDFADTEAEVPVGDPQKLHSGIFPVVSGGVMKNPFTGATFTTLDQICQYMIDYRIQRPFMFYSSSVTINDYSGSPIPGGVFVTISNVNYLTFFVELRGNGQVAAYPITTAGGVLGGARSAGVITPRGEFDAVVMKQNTTNGVDKFNRIFGVHRTSSEEDILYLDMQALASANNLMLGGGSGVYNACQTVRMYTATNPTDLGGTLRWLANNAGHWQPGTDNAYDIGLSGTRPRQIYAANSTISTSDARKKTEVKPLSKAEIAAACDLAAEIGTYQFLDAVEEKGEAARRHAGMTVQRSIEVMERHGLDPMAYGFICYDKWDASPEETETVIVKGKKVKRVTRPAIEAGDLYSFRTDQLAMFIARGQSQRQSEIEKRLAKLEAGK